MKQTERHAGGFGEGHAFRTAGGLTYRIVRSVRLNGVDLIVYETIHNAIRTESAAMPIADFSRMLEVEKAVLITHASD